MLSHAVNLKIVESLLQFSALVVSDFLLCQAHHQNQVKEVIGSLSWIVFGSYCFNPKWRCRNAISLINYSSNANSHCLKWCYSGNSPYSKTITFKGKYSLDSYAFIKVGSGDCKTPTTLRPILHWPFSLEHLIQIPAQPWISLYGFRQVYSFI